MTGPRKGERIGWLLGWAGSFLWLLLFSVWMLAAGSTGFGLAAAALFLLAGLCIAYLSPWRRPSTPYWKLMAPIYLIFLAAVKLVVLWFRPAYGTELKPWQLLWVLPCFTPLFILGNKTWSREEENRR